MDGAKLATDTAGHSQECAVNRRLMRAEAYLKKCVDLIEMRILAIVRS